MRFECRVGLTLVGGCRRTATSGLVVVGVGEAGDRFVVSLFRWNARRAWAAAAEGWRG